MRKEFRLLGVVFLVLVFVFGVADSRSDSDSKTSMLSIPWYKQFNHKIVNPAKGVDYLVKYDLDRLDLSSRSLTFYDVYSGKKIEGAELESYNLLDKKSEKLFLDFIFKEEIYRVDTNGDGDYDVIHRISYLPTKYLKDKFCKRWGIQTQTMEGFLRFVRMAFEKGIGMNESILHRDPQILVDVKVDLPPYDGRVDVIISDARHPAKSFADSYGGDGIPDDERFLSEKSDIFPQRNQSQSPGKEQI